MDTQSETGVLPVAADTTFPARVGLQERKFEKSKRTRPQTRSSAGAEQGVPAAASTLVHCQTIVAPARCELLASAVLTSLVSGKSELEADQ